jgi:hypothetical protein
LSTFTQEGCKDFVPKVQQEWIYSKREVIVFAQLQEDSFDGLLCASAVFASLLSCPTLNQDECFLLHDQKNPFAQPSKSAVGNINTGRCYRKMYDALVKKIGVDIILPTILAMDKTHIGLAGHLQNEPITMLRVLLRHGMRSKPIAMQILGYNNHTSSTHFPQQSTDKTTTNSNVPNCPLLPGTVIADAPLKHLKNISWPACILNEMHMQIDFILEHSGFLRLQNHGFKWNIQYNKQIHPIALHPFIPFIIGDTEGNDCHCGHFTARFKEIKQLCRVYESPTLESVLKGKVPSLKSRYDKQTCPMG